VRENLSRPDVWIAVSAIARRLIEQGELTGSEVEELAHRTLGVN